MSVFYNQKKAKMTGFGSLSIIVICIGLFITFITGLMYGLPAYSRYQRLQNERNLTQVNDIKIAQTRQLVQVAEQTKQITIVNAEGIASSQKIINGTLTNQYLQYLAIDAQKAEINSPSHTVIYVPSGNNGIPLVQTVNPQQ
jgi:hypothetical protein